MSAYVLLEDGTRFDGEAVGAHGSVTGEVVFTTGMSGYQESMTDPSFARQLITFTTAHVGNYGVSEAAMESDRIHAAGAIMRAAVDYDDAPSAEQGWLSWLREHGIPGHQRRRHARAGAPHPLARAAMRGGIFAADVPEREARERVDAEPSMVGRDLAREVTTPRAARITKARGGPRIVALDTGIKRSIIRNFTSRGATLEILPCTSTAEELLARDPDGFFLVPGPGDPAALDYIVENIRTLLTHQAGVRDLPRPPAALARRGTGDVQAALRPPRRQPPGQGPADRPDRDHVARTTASRSPGSPARSSSPSSAPPSSPT